MNYLILYTIVIQYFGAIFFLGFIINVDKEEGTNKAARILSLPLILRVPLLFMWPIILIWWFFITAITRKSS